MKIIIQSFLITYLLTAQNLQAMQSSLADAKDEFTLKNESHSLTPFMEKWFVAIQNTLTLNNPKYIKYSGDNLWIYAGTGRPFAIIKPNHQSTRPSPTSSSKWRTVRHYGNESASLYLAYQLGFKRMLPLYIPLPYKSYSLSYLEDPIEGSVEFPIELLNQALFKSTDESTIQLREFGKFLLNLQSKELAKMTYSMSLADLNMFIDGDYGEMRKKMVHGKDSVLKVKGCKEFHYSHMKFFLDHVNKDSLINAGLLDMLLYHRDMKADNVMLRINADGFHFIIIDFEYAMLPFVTKKVKSKKAQLFLNNATGINFRPFYIDFPQAKEPIPKKHFEQLLQLTHLKIQAILSHKISLQFSKEGVDDFLIRLNWLQNIARKVVSDEVISPSLCQLHKSFKNTYLGQNKTFKDFRFFNKERYYYTDDQLWVLNPSRAPHEASVDVDIKMLEMMETSLVTSQIIDLSDSKNTQDAEDGYENLNDN